MVDTVEEEEVVATAVDVAETEVVAGVVDMEVGVTAVVEEVADAVVVAEGMVVDTEVDVMEGKNKDLNFI